MSIGMIKAGSGDRLAQTLFSAISSFRSKMAEFKDVMLLKVEDYSIQNYMCVLELLSFVYVTLYLS